MRDGWQPSPHAIPSRRTKSACVAPPRPASVAVEAEAEALPYFLHPPTPPYLSTLRLSVALAKLPVLLKLRPLAGWSESSRASAASIIDIGLSLRDSPYTIFLHSITQQSFLAPLPRGLTWLSEVVKHSKGPVAPAVGPFKPSRVMSQAIDLTADADSPPRPAPPALTLPVGRGTPSGPAGTTGSTATASSSATPSGPPPSFLDTVIGGSGNRSNAGTSGGASSSSRRPGGSSSSASTARPGAVLSRRDREFLNDASGSSSSSAARRNRAPLPNRRIRSNSSSLADGAATGASAPSVRRPMVRDPTDDGFELTGMSEGARQAAERARREAEESQRWRQGEWHHAAKH